MLSPENLIALVPTGAIALLLLQRLVEVVKISKYGPAIAEALKALNDGKLTKSEFDDIQSKM